MKPYLLLFCLGLISESINGQKIFKTKQESVLAITQARYEARIPKDYPEDFFYIRTDELGESLVVYFTDGPLVKTVAFRSNDPVQVTNRCISAFKSSKSYKVDPVIAGVFTATATIYYDGNARYRPVMDYNLKKFYLEITILD